MSKLQLTRPLAAFDTETTGAKPQIDRIVEIGLIILNVDGTQFKYHSYVNPGIPIPAEATAVHSITDEMVKDAPVFATIAPMLLEVLADVDLITFNGNNFDIPLMLEEFKLAGLTWDLSTTDFVDVGVLFKILAPRTLGAAVMTYLGKELEGAHGAIADTQATIDVLDAMMDEHPHHLADTVPELALQSNYGKKRLDLAGKFAYRNDDVIIITFGKHKDQPAFKERSYLQWMIGGDFPADTKRVAQGILDATIM